MRILYVEDDPFDADLTERELRRSAPQLTLERARTLQEASALIQAEAGRLAAGAAVQYDLVLTDLRLPDGEGLALLGQIREAGLPTAVVVITGQGDDEKAIAILKAGADDYIVKRKDYLKRLPLILEDAFTRHHSRRAQTSQPLRVLYAEHSTTDADLTRRHFLRNAPYIQLEVVGSVDEVLARLPQGGGGDLGADVILLDYRLPGANALEAIKEIRQTRQLDVPVVLVTGQGDEDIATQAVKLGADEYLSKHPGYLHRLPTVLENAYHRVQLAREQAALRLSEERFRRLAENAPDLIFRFRWLPEPFGFEYLSPAAFDLTGYSPQEFYDRPSLPLEITHPSDQPLAQLAVRGKVRLDTPLTVRITRKDGSPAWLELRSTGVYNEEGQLASLEGIVRDVSERKRSEEAIHRQLDRLSGLRSVDMAISSSLDLRVTLAVLLEQAMQQLGVDAADVLLYNAARQRFDYVAGRGFRRPDIERSHPGLKDSLAGRTVIERQTICQNLREHPNVGSREFGEMLAGEGFLWYCGAPLLVKGEMHGVLEVYQRKPFEADSEWRDYFDTLSGQAAIAIENARLFERLQRSNAELILAYDSTLEGWVRALDLRDKETEGHSQRVADLTLQLARRLHFSDAELVHIRRGALLHDLGKLGIPDAILQKPGPLTEAEWEIMHRHPEFVYEVLGPIQYLRPALDIPYCHHEKWDGTGYPRGLKADEIPLAARIFAIVDVWDALTTDRPYRRAWPPAEARAYLRAQSGQHFDPRVVEAFLELVA